MNHLAHLLLANDDLNLLVGGFLGDFVKGRLKGERPEAIEAGIQLHRAIDQFTDFHPLVIRCRSLLPTNSRRVSGIIIDIAFDHYLACEWAQFSSIDLQTFDTETFERLLVPTMQRHFPNRALIACQAMQTRKSLLRTRDSGFIDQSLLAIGKRLRGGDQYFNFEARQSIHEALPSIQPYFREFFASLQGFVDNWRECKLSSSAAFADGSACHIDG